jgi:hypothetical protein
MENFKGTVPDHWREWALYGRWWVGGVRKSLCTFNTFKRAEDYLHKWKLKKKDRYGNEFKVGSLLRGYRDITLEAYEPIHPPHNPE